MKGLGTLCIIIITLIASVYLGLAVGERIYGQIAPAEVNEVRE